MSNKKFRYLYTHVACLAIAKPEELNILLSLADEIVVRELETHDFDKNYSDKPNYKMLKKMLQNHQITLLKYVVVADLYANIAAHMLENHKNGEMFYFVGYYPNPNMDYFRVVGNVLIELGHHPIFLQYKDGVSFNAITGQKMTLQDLFYADQYANKGNVSSQGYNNVNQTVDELHNMQYDQVLEQGYAIEVDEDEGEPVIIVDDDEGEIAAPTPTPVPAPAPTPTPEPEPEPEPEVPEEKPDYSDIFSVGVSSAPEESETPVESPVEAPEPTVEVLEETPIEAPEPTVETPEEAPIETPEEEPEEAPNEPATEEPEETPSETPETPEEPNDKPEEEPEPEELDSFFKNFEF